MTVQEEASSLAHSAQSGVIVYPVFSETSSQEAHPLNIMTGSQ